MKSPFNYILEIQYMGFRFHGWAKQPGVKTVHHMVDRTLAYVLKHENFKTLGSSRTDARVSARSFWLQIFLTEAIDDSPAFLDDLNANLPADISALSMREVDSSFNIIQAPKNKEYRYYFYFGKQKYPFAAPFFSYFPTMLHIDKMQEGARLFQGKHDFRRYVTQPSSSTVTQREILQSEIVINSDITGNMFPRESYVYVIRAEGFMRHQIRLMMGQLVQLGSENIDRSQLIKSITEPSDERLDYIAPGSGLVLHSTNYDFNVAQN